MSFFFPPDLCRVLCIGAHADDIEIGCGSTIAALLKHRPNTQLDWVVCSSSGTRRVEAAESAREYLGRDDGERIHLASFRDSYFPAQYASIKAYLHELAARIRPQLVFTHRLEDRHQDHALLGELTWNVFRGPLILEYEIPKFEGDLAPMELYIPCDRESARLKVDRLMRHFPTQQHRHWFDEETFFAHLRMRGIECGSEARYAEAFRCRKAMLRW